MHVFILVYKSPKGLNQALVSILGAFELHHHDGDVIRAAAVEWLQHDAFGTKVWLVKALSDKAYSLLIAEGIPQAVRGQDHELRLQFVKVEGQDVRIGYNNIEVF